MLALPNATGPAFTLSAADLALGCAAAAASPRQRIILPIHRSQDALVQRMLNFLQPTTYIAPHLHPLPFASETIHVVQGSIGFLLFSADGQILEQHLLTAGPTGLIDIEPNVWHGFVALEPNTVILEVKRGPYAGAEDKVFAPWAPTEDSANAATQLVKWKAHF
jgi:cupin fold WbuC family metalloprotein